MRFVMFYQSLISDWNHGNAHFLRGIVRELTRRGHEVSVFEPRDGWSLRSLLAEQGDAAISEFAAAYPGMRSRLYDLEDLDFDLVLGKADVVIVHEWNHPHLFAAIAAHRRRNPHYRLFFHDTHHRMVSDPNGFAVMDLAAFDAVLAFGQSLAALYRQRQAQVPVFVWHEAADVARFCPPATPRPAEGDLVWVGNWGDDERTAELDEFLIGPVRRLRLRARVFGVRYPDHALAALESAGIEYGGWLPNFAVPEVFARHRVTVHIPRRHYARTLPGIPTIRPFEAMACGIPLVSAPWSDSERLFEPDRDYLLAGDGAEMTRHLALLLANPHRARALSESGRARILAAHTCAHRVEELFGILAELDGEAPADFGKERHG
jgi:spore maturation protein CgeB